MIGDARIAIEIKSTDHIETEHKKGLKKFVEEHPDAKQIIVSRDRINHLVEPVKPRLEIM